jgi:hypothetical protein
LSRGGEYKSMSTRQDADDTRAFRRQPGEEYCVANPCTHRERIYVLMPS